MATSTKVVFNLEKLQAHAVESIDLKIALAKAKVERYIDEAALAERVAEWRSTQEARLSDLFRNLDQIGDHQLSQFKIQDIPRADTYSRRDAQRSVETLEARRLDIMAKSSSLVADADGSIALTTTQLDQFFGL